jgi:hypothetical protein
VTTPPAAVATPPKPSKEPIPFPLSKEELATLTAGLGALFAEQSPYEEAVAQELMKKSAQAKFTPTVKSSFGYTPEEAEEAEVDVPETTPIGNLHEAEVQLASLAKGKGLHPIKDPEQFIPILEEMLRQSPAFAAAFPDALKALIVTNDATGLVISASVTKDPRYATALEAEMVVPAVQEVATDLFPAADPTDFNSLTISVRKASLDLWPQVDKLPNEEKAVIVAMLLGLAGTGPTTSETGQEVKDLMAEMEARLNAIRASISNGQNVVYNLTELDKVIDQWEVDRANAEAEGDQWVPGTIRKVRGFHGEPTGLWEVVEEPKVVPKGGAAVP